MDDEQPRTRWEQLTGGTSGRDYAARFEALAATGTDVHGEARFCAALVPPGSRVLDAGCGTGRVAIRLAELGYACVGVDADASMLAVAAEAAPALPWLQADLADLHAVALGEPFDLVVMAGNVVPLLAPGTLPAVMSGLARSLRPLGLLVAGFGLDQAHLPRGCPVTSVEEYDAAAAAAGLERVERFAGWDQERWTATAGYAVSIHRKSGPVL